MSNTDSNYNSHNWIGGLSGGPCDPQDYISYCKDCGIEDIGDPAEFDIEYQYPNCSDTLSPSPSAVINLKYVRVEIWSEQKCVATVFNDTAHTCVGSRDDSQQNRDEASRQGYTADEKGVWKSLVEHEILHSLVAEVMSNMESRVALAESGKQITPTWERYEEEAIVLSIQYLINTNQITSTLDRFLHIENCGNLDNEPKDGWLGILGRRWRDEIIPVLSAAGVFS